MKEDLSYQKTMLDYVAADTSGHEFKNAEAFLNGNALFLDTITLGW